MSTEATLDRNAALLVIDVQEAFDHPRWGRRNNPQAEQNVARLLAAWRRSGRPIVHVKHDSLEPGSLLRAGEPGNAIKAEAAPLAGEPIVRKHVNSAFIGTDLEARLRQGGTDTVVVVGLITNHCVSTTARMAGNLGFRTLVVADACATFDMKAPSGRVIPAEEMHEVGLAELDGEFAAILETDGVLARLEG